MFGAPRENRVFYIERGLQRYLTVRDTGRDTSLFGVAKNEARHLFKSVCH